MIEINTKILPYDGVVTGEVWGDADEEAEEEEGREDEWPETGQQWPVTVSVVFLSSFIIHIDCLRNEVIQIQQVGQLRQYHKKY